MICFRQIDSTGDELVSYMLSDAFSVRCARSCDSCRSRRGREMCFMIMSECAYVHEVCLRVLIAMNLADGGHYRYELDTQA